jgi:hypothetical protein
MNGILYIYGKLCLLLAGSFFDLFFDPEDGSSAALRNFGNIFSEDIMSHLKLCCSF